MDRFRQEYHIHFGETKREVLDRSLAVLNLAVINNPKLRDKALTYISMGRLHEAKGELKNAIKCFETSLSIHEESNDLYGKTVNLRDIGYIYFRTGEYAKALKNLSEALEILKKNNVEDSLVYKDVVKLIDKLGNKDYELLGLLAQIPWDEREEGLWDFSEKIEGTPFLEEHFLEILEFFEIWAEDDYTSGLEEMEAPLLYPGEWREYSETTELIMHYFEKFFNEIKTKPVVHKYIPRIIKWFSTMYKFYNFRKFFLSSSSPFSEFINTLNDTKLFDAHLIQIFDWFEGQDHEDIEEPFSTLVEILQGIKLLDTHFPRLLTILYNFPGDDLFDDYTSERVIYTFDNGQKVQVSHCPTKKSELFGKLVRALKESNLLETHFQKILDFLEDLERYRIDFIREFLEIIKDTNLNEIHSKRLKAILDSSKMTLENKS